MLENSRGRFAWPSPNCYDGSDLNNRVAGRRGDVIDNKRVQRRTRAVTFEVVNLPRVPADPKRYRGQCPDDCARNRALDGARLSFELFRGEAVLKRSARLPRISDSKFRT